MNTYGVVVAVVLSVSSTCNVCANPMSSSKTFPQSLPVDLTELESRYAALSGLATGSKAAQDCQKKWVNKLGLPLEVTTKKTGIKLRLIPPGKVSLGSPLGEHGRSPREIQNQASLSQPFYCGKFEVTQRQWKLVMGNNPSLFKNSGYSAPVENISWDECQNFLDELCKLEGVPQGTYQLLTAQQWEYACRAGTNTPFCYGNKLGSNMANVEGVSPYNAPPGVDRQKTIKVGSFKFNAWGLYDMHGNVWEWCVDHYGDCPKVERDKKEWEKAGCREYRGGSWNFSAKYARSASRQGFTPSSSDDDLGLRIMRKIPSQRKQRLALSKVK